MSSGVTELPIGSCYRTRHGDSDRLTVREHWKRWTILHDNYTDKPCWMLTAFFVALVRAGYWQLTDEKENTHDSGCEPVVAPAAGAAILP